MCMLHKKRVSEKLTPFYDKENYVYRTKATSPFSNSSVPSLYFNRTK